MLRRRYHRTLATLPSERFAVWSELLSLRGATGFPVPRTILLIIARHTAHVPPWPTLKPSAAGAQSTPVSRTFRQYRRRLTLHLKCQDQSRLAEDRAASRSRPPSRPS